MVYVDIDIHALQKHTSKHPLLTLRGAGLHPGLIRSLAPPSINYVHDYKKCGRLQNFTHITIHKPTHQGGNYREVIT